MKRKLGLTVGNQMMGDDAAGPLLAQAMLDSPVDGWDVLDGGSTPENCLHLIREMAPEIVVIVDAADMDLRSGEIRLIDKDWIKDVFLMTTHSMPLTYLMKSIQEFVPMVELIGIQPEVVAFGSPVSPRVRQAVERAFVWFKETGKGTRMARTACGEFYREDWG